MKKTMIFATIALAACATTTDNSAVLTRLKSEPTNCEFLYTIDTSFSDYNMNKAYDFLEKRILEQQMIGDSYYIEKEDIVDNLDAIFGPKTTYKFKAKVYNCKK